MESLLINGHTALDTVVTVSVKGKDVLNAPRGKFIQALSLFILNILKHSTHQCNYFSTVVQLAFALLMEEADGAHFQDVIKALVTSISVQRESRVVSTLQSRFNHDYSSFI